MRFDGYSKVKIKRENLIANISQELAKQSAKINGHYTGENRLSRMEIAVTRRKITRLSKRLYRAFESQCKLLPETF